MKLSDPRLWEAKSVQDFLFRLNFRDEDLLDIQIIRSSLIPYNHIIDETFVTPSNTRIWGVDISHWNGIVDLSKAKALGCSFVILKGCDGSIPTRNFEQNKQNSKDNGLPWGVYFWLYRAQDVSIQIQTSAWWKQVKDDYPPLGVFIDFEWTTYNRKPSNPTSADLSAALNSYHTLSGREAGIYSAKGYTDDYLTHDSKWAKYKWWVANYGVTTPLMPYGISAWQFWQFTDNLDGKSLGINTLDGDGNYYWGTLEEFEQEFGLTHTEPQEDDVTKEELIAALLPIYSKMDEIILGVREIAERSGETTTPPVTTTPVRNVTLKGTNNRLVPSYDLPDINSTKCTIYQPNNQPKESVPPAGHKGMPKEPNLLEREIHARNLFKEWAWLPKQILKKANGNLYAFPDVGLQGQDVSEYPGMWVPRSSLLTSSPDAWIESIIADLRKQWGVV